MVDANTGSSALTIAWAQALRRPTLERGCGESVFRVENAAVGFSP